MKREIVVAEQAGYCFGVRRALDMAKEHLTKTDRKVYSLGPLFHNPQVMRELQEKGLAQADSVEDVHEGVLVIRSHGVEKGVLEEVRAKGLEIVDATCPFVKNAQRLAHKLSDENYQLVIVGEAHHPEVRGILSYATKEALVVGSAEDLDVASLGSKVGILAQTTQSFNNFAEVVTAVLRHAYECRVYNTICNATASRQAGAVELAATVDAMFVVGGKNSANTTRLAELCRAAGASTHHIETPDEITPDMIRGKRRIGITAGASTPHAQVEQVQKTLEKMSEEMKE
ncbi:MAG: 4-hydroxy-3-methylbut-2-enyl diphosphate reductase [Candidatus Abyssubacteria bacterium]